MRLRTRSWRRARSGGRLRARAARTTRSVSGSTPPGPAVRSMTPSARTAEDEVVAQVDELKEGL